METYKLLSNKRDLKLNAKKIRKEGFVPAVIYGHHLGSINIQINHIEVSKFLKTNSIGSKVLLVLENDEHLAIFKDSQRDPLSNKIMHIDFQALTSGEKIKVTVPIIFENKDSFDSNVVFQEQISEIEISVLPKNLIDHVTIDVSKYGLGDSLLIGDLDIMKNKNIEVLSSKDSQVFTISHAPKYKEELPNDEEQIIESHVLTESTEE